MSDEPGDSKKRARQSGLFKSRRAVTIGITGLLVIGLALSLVFVFVIDDSTPVHADTASAYPTTGNGRGTSVPNPPPKDTAAVLSHNVGRCAVPIRNSYDKLDWQAQTKCVQNWGLSGQLITVKNESTVPVFLNEWYGWDLHGETPVLPGQSISMPVWGALANSIYVGACWPGPGGPGTCQNGPEHQHAIVNFIRVDPVPENSLLFVRDENGQGIPAVRGKSWAAVNLGRYAVQLHWPALGRDKWVDLPVGGRVENIPPGDIKARKDFGTGAVALVQLIPTPHERGTDLYRMVTPNGRDGLIPYATMTVLNGSWCSVHLQNLGPESVRLQVWSVPYLVPSGDDLSLADGQSGTLTVRNTLLVTGVVGRAEMGNFTTLKATDWRKC